MDRQRRFRKLLAQAKAHTSKKAWRQARVAANKAGIYCSNQSDRRQLQEIYRQLDVEGQRRLESCERLGSRGKYLEVAERCKDIIHTFRKLPCAVAAARMLARVEAAPQYKRLLREKKVERLDGAVEKMLRGEKRTVAGAGPSNTQTLQEERKASVLSILNLWV